MNAQPVIKNAPRPVTGDQFKVEFVMPKYSHTGYEGKHNHKGIVGHRFLVELSYARERWNAGIKTPMSELSSLIHYAQVYAMENHVYTQYAAESRTHVDMSKVVLHVAAGNLERVQELIFELRYHIGVITGANPNSTKGHVFFNVTKLQNYLVD